MFAQEIENNESGSWYSLINNVKIDEKLSVGSVLELRMVDFAQNQRVFLFVPQVNYKLNKTLSLSIGYSHLNFSQTGIRPPSLNYEDRLFQQVQLTHGNGKVKFGHRFRLEERFKTALDQSSSYANRYRYRFSADFNIVRFSNGTHFIGRIYDELRIGFGSGLREPKFDQNYFAALVGYALNKHSKLYLGYGRNVYRSSVSGHWGDHLLHVKFHYNIDLTHS